MLPRLKRHTIQVLVAAGHAYVDVARFAAVNERTVRRVAREAPVTELEDVAPQHRVGRPSTAEPYRQLVTDVLGQEPMLLSVEILRRARLAGYDGGKTALYDLIASVRPHDVKVEMRFEGVPGEFSQHDFGQIEIRFRDGSIKRVHFFASRLKWSRWIEVTVVPDETAETLIRTLADHFVAFGGVPLCAVFDRPKTVALKWKKNGEITEWNPIFAYAALEIGFTAEVCWPYQPRQKGAVEELVKWVKGSFFKQRRFQEMDDLLAQLTEWLTEMNTERPSRATGVIPAVRREQERLRAPRVQPAELALRIPVSVGPTAEVLHDTHAYSMPPDAAGLPGTLYLYRDRVRIVAGRHEVVHECANTNTALRHGCPNIVPLTWPPSPAPGPNATSNASISSKPERPQYVI